MSWNVGFNTSIGSDSDMIVFENCGAPPPGSSFCGNTRIGGRGAVVRVSNDYPPMVRVATKDKILELHGIPSEMPDDFLRQAVELYNATRDDPTDVREEKFMHTAASRWLQDFGNGASILSLLVQVAANGYLVPLCVALGLR